MVEHLLGYRAIDIACGSGDAQTLCITDDDNGKLSILFYYFYVFILKLNCMFQYGVGEMEIMEN